MASLSLTADHAFGMTGSDVHMVDKRTVAYACSNSISFLDVKSNSHSLLWGLGLSVGAIAAHHESNTIAFAEKKVRPVVYVVTYPEREVLATLRGSAELEITSLCFSRDGKYLAALGGAPDFSLSVWEWETGLSLVEDETLEGPLCPGHGTVSFSPISPRTLFVSGGFDDEAKGVFLHLVPHFDSHLVQKTPINMDHLAKDGITRITSHCWGADGDTLYLGTNNGNVLISVIDFQQREIEIVARKDLSVNIDADSDVAVGEGKPMENEVRKMFLTRRGLIACLESNEFFWMRPTDLSVIKRIDINKSNANANAEDDVSENSSNNNNNSNDDGLLSASFAPGMQTIAIATTKKRLLVGNLSFSDSAEREGGGEREGLGDHNDVSGVGEGEGDGQGGMAETIELDVKCVADFHNGAVKGVAPIPFTHRLVTCGVDGTLRGWDYRTHRLVWKLDLSVPLTAVAASFDGALIAVGSELGVLRVYDATSKRGPPRLIHRTRLGNTALGELAFDPLGNYLAIGSVSKVVFVDARVVEGQENGDGDNDGQLTRPSITVALEDGAETNISVTSSWRVLGTCELQGIVSGLEWDADVERGVYQLFASVLPGDLYRLEPPSLDHVPDQSFKLANIDVRLALVKTESTPLAIALSPTKGNITDVADDVERNRQMLFTALGNNSISLYAYPEETGDPDLMDETDISPAVGTVTMLDMPGTSLTVSPDQTLLAVGGKDGVVRLGPCHDFGSALREQIHDPWVGGISQLSFCEDSTRLFSVGSDGVVTVWFLNRDSNGNGVDKTSSLDESLLSSYNTVKDKVDSEKEPDFIEVHQIQLKDAAIKRHADSKSRVLNDVNALRTKLKDLLGKNETVTDLERLEQSEFVIDLDRREELQRKNAEKISELRADMERDNIGRELVADRIKIECIESMEVVGVKLKAFVEDTAVSNYSLIRQPPDEEIIDEKLRNLRRVELAEFRIRHPMDAPTLLRQNDPGRGASRVGSRLGHQGSHTGSASVRSETPEYSRAGGVTPIRDEEFGDAGEEAVETEYDLLYDTYELHTPRRKMTQLRFLRSLIREKKKAFNAEFDRFFTMKTDEVSRINERNTRIFQILKELGVDEDVWEYEPDDDEHPENVLRVNQETVSHKRGDTLEEESTVDKPHDDAMARGLRVMMGGKLEKRSEEQALDEELEKPEWMSKPVAQMSEEELEAVKEFEKKEALLNEERNKRRKALETELRKLQQQIQEYMASFDEKLAKLYEMRLESDEKVHELQLKLVKLVQELLQERIMERREQELLAQQEELNLKKTNSTQRVADFRRELERLTAVYERAVKEDKEYERNFKRDFLDQPERIDTLYRLFRSRRRSPTVRLPTNEELAGNDDPYMEHDIKAASSRAIEQDPEGIERPPGWEDSLWYRLVDARAAKLSSEATVRQAQKELVAAESAFTELRKEDDSLANAIMTLGRELNMFHKERAQTRIDLHVLMRLKQGQVEVETGGEVLSDYADAVLINQDIVHDLNSEINRIGQDKVSLLEKLRALGHAERLVQWELSKCDMEAEDLLGQIRDFQLLRVTKQLQLLIRGGGEDRGTEIAALEKRRAQARAAHEHRQSEATRQLRRVKKKINDLEKQNTSLSGQISELEAAVGERMRINTIQQAGGAHGAGGRTGEERFRDVANMRRMRDIVRAQQDEVAALKAELRRLRLRSFPTFAKEKHVTDGL